MFGFADWLDVTEYGEEQLPIILYTDCKSLYDHLRKDGAVPDDKWIAVATSRWQLADCLTKPGLGKVLRGILQAGVTRLHELSLAQVRKAKSGKSVAQGVHYVGCVSVPGDCDFDEDRDEDFVEDREDDLILTLPTSSSLRTLLPDTRWPLQATCRTSSSGEAGCFLVDGYTYQTQPDLTTTITTTPTSKILRDPLCSSSCAEIADLRIEHHFASRIVVNLSVEAQALDWMALENPDRLNPLESYEEGQVLSLALEIGRAPVINLKRQ